VQRDGIRVRADSTPRRTSCCRCSSRIASWSPTAAVRLRRANLIQTLMSFSGPVDADIELRFGSSPTTVPPARRHGQQGAGL
jgi:hypothetical protein